MPDIRIQPYSGGDNFFDQFDAPKANQFRDNVANVESGGRYDAVGPVTRDGDRAFGKYQVMGKNIGPWTAQVFGRPLSVEEFLTNPEAQDAVFDRKFGEYQGKYGPGGASRAWFAGEGGMNDLGRRDQLGTSVAQYENRVMSYAPQGGQQAQAGNFFDQFDDGQPPQGPDTFAQRFGQPQPPAGGGNDLNKGLLDRAEAMTRGPAQHPFVRMDTDYQNLLSAATQGTNPNIDRYKGRVISTETFESDSGEILYRDPATGQVVPTNSKTQVAIRDPYDGVVKVYSRSEDTNEGPLVGASRVLAPGLAAGAPTARPGIATPSAKAITPRASDIMATAKPYYQAFQKQGGKIAIPLDKADEIAGRLRVALDKVNLTDEMAGAPARSAIRMLEKGTVQNLDDLQKVKRVAGRGFASAEKDVRDGAAAISREIGKVISEISKPASQNLKTGDAIQTTAYALQDLQRKGSIAGLRTGRAGYGGNAVNNMRQVLSPIVEKSIKGQRTGFNPSEIAAIREIVEGTNTTNALRAIGQLSPSKGIIATTVGGATGGTTAAAGMIANKTAAILTGKQVDRLMMLVAKRSPEYSKAVLRALDRYEKAQSAFVATPSPNKFAAYVSASRALSAGLTKDGIAITSGDLLRAVQGPMKSAADGENPESVGVGNQ